MGSAFQKSQSAIKCFIARENYTAKMNCNHTGKQRMDSCAYNTILSANSSLQNCVRIKVNISVLGTNIALNCCVFQTYLVLLQNLAFLDQKKRSFNISG